MPADIALNIPNTPRLALAVVLTALTGIGGRFGIISSADLGAYIARLCSGVSFASVGSGSVFTLTVCEATFCAANIARVLFALGIVNLHSFNKRAFYSFGCFTIRA
jgi:hypothetical protein